MNQNSGDDERSEGKGGADAPLHEALDDLENMLGPHGATTPDSKDAPVGGAEEDWDSALYRATAQRLASELEIIMNARLEAALARVGEEIRREVRNHIEIVLPEIVSALAAAETPPRRDYD
jgi:hypothetical protein